MPTVPSSEDFTSANEAVSSYSSAAGTHMSEPGRACSPPLIRIMQEHALLEYIFNLRWVDTKKSELAEKATECYMANNWSRRCDGARPNKHSSVDESAKQRWHDSIKDWPLSIERWLGEAEENTHPADYSDEGMGEGCLSSYPGITWISHDHIEILMNMIVADILRSNFRTHLFERVALIVWQAVKGLDKHLAISRLCDALNKSNPSSLTEMSQQIQAIGIDYCILAFVIPDFFGTNVRGLTQDEVTENLLNLSLCAHGSQTLPDFVEAFRQGDHVQYLEGFWTRIHKELIDLRLSNSNPIILNTIKLLSSISYMREILVEQKIWLGSSTRQQAAAGSLFITETLLGRLMQATMVDWSIPPTLSRSKEKSVVEELQPHIVANGALPSLTAVLNRLKQSQASHIQTIVVILKAFLKHGGKVRQAVLNWFGKALELNKEQTKMSFRHAQNQIPRWIRQFEISAISKLGTTPSCILS